MGKVRNSMPPEALAHLDKLAAEEHQRFLDQGQATAEPVLTPDENLGVYSLRLTNRERLLLRQLATMTGRPATEIAREFIRKGIEESLSPQGKIRPKSEIGLKYLASIAQSISSFATVFELKELKKIAEEGSATKADKPSRKKGA